MASDNNNQGQGQNTPQSQPAQQPITRPGRDASTYQQRDNDSREGPRRERRG